MIPSGRKGRHSTFNRFRDYARASLPCVSLRFSQSGACGNSDCLLPIATLLEANGVTVVRPFTSFPAVIQDGQPGCVGIRTDIGGTTQEAECLIQLLGSNYTLDPTGCRADGFPHMVVAR